MYLLMSRNILEEKVMMIVQAIFKSDIITSNWLTKILVGVSSPRKEYVQDLAFIKPMFKIFCQSLETKPNVFTHLESRIGKQTFV